MSTRIPGTLLLLFTTLLLISHSAIAEILVEPKIGVEFANEKKERSGRIDNESSRILYGYSWGVRLGYVFSPFQFAFEMAQSDLFGEEDENDASDEGRVQLYEHAVVIGYEAGDLNLWVTKILYTFIEDKSEFIGTGYRLGLGFPLYGLTWANVEYVSKELSRDTVGDIVSIEDKLQSLVFSISIPFIF